MSASVVNEVGMPPLHPANGKSAMEHETRTDGGVGAGDREATGRPMAGDVCRLDPAPPEKSRSRPAEQKTLAVDLGTHTGWALMTGGKIIDSGTELLASDEELEQQREEAKERTSDMRFGRILDFVEGKVAAGVDRIVFEDVIFAGSQAQTQLWSSLRTAIWLAGRDAKVSIHCVAVATLKRFATGNGAARKPDLARPLPSRNRGATNWSRGVDCCGGMDRRWTTMKWTPSGWPVTPPLWTGEKRVLSGRISGRPRPRRNAARGGPRPRRRKRRASQIERSRSGPNGGSCWNPSRRPADAAASSASRCPLGGRSVPNAERQSELPGQSRRNQRQRRGPILYPRTRLAGQRKPPRKTHSRRWQALVAAPRSWPLGSNGFRLEFAFDGNTGLENACHNGPAWRGITFPGRQRAIVAAASQRSANCCQTYSHA